MLPKAKWHFSYMVVLLVSFSSVCTVGNLVEQNYLAGFVACVSVSISGSGS